MRSTFLTVMLLGCGVELGDEVADETVGESQTGACASGSWCVETSPATAMLRSVSAAAADAVFAVGDGGTIVRRTAAGWVQDSSGTNVTLKGVFAITPRDAWAVGAGGFVTHWNGETWTQVNAGTTANLQAVWASSVTDIWMAASGLIFRSTNGGTTWTTTSKSGSLYAISGTGPNHVLVTGENSNVYEWNGSKWTTLKPTTSTTTYFGIAALSPTNVWATSFYPGKESLQNSGTSTWAPRRTSIYNGAIAARSPSEIYAVGASKVGVWNGGGWTAYTPAGTGVNLYGVAGTPLGSDGHWFAVGKDATGRGLILHYTN